MDLDFVTRYVNVPILKEPLNWAIIWVIASIWLMAFHVIMQAWTAMISPGTATIGAGPGQIAAPIPDVTTQFAVPANYGYGDALSVWTGGATTVWTDGSESKYAEDGWTGNA